MNIETAIPAEALSALRAPFQAEPADMIDPPVVQPLNLFLDLAGEAMRARLFVVQSEGRDEACLRPELTIPVARAHIASGRSRGRYLYEGKAFRAAPRGGETGHPEEFLQLGLEIYGDVDPAAEAHVLALAWRSASAGGRTDLRLRLGDASLFSAFALAIGASAATAARLQRAFGRKGALELELDRAVAAVDGGQSGGLARMLAGLPESEASDLLDELWSLAGIQPVGGRPAAEIVGRLVRRGAGAEFKLDEAQAELIRRYLAITGEPRGALDAVARLAASAGADLSAALEVWSRRIDALEAAGAPVARATFAAGFGRGFGYYDGFLFDVTSDALGDDRPVAGGGRYDTLLVRLGCASAPGAVGCMVRPGRAWKEAGQ